MGVMQVARLEEIDDITSTDFWRPHHCDAIRPATMDDTFPLSFNRFGCSQCSCTLPYVLQRVGKVISVTISAVVAGVAVAAVTTRPITPLESELHGRACYKLELMS
eukprot:FR734730.1.p2 GENE.FR734730.1~~FR734730.1.p2  ORF type:complete len:106 (-),score=3.42 FR734730.1:283-600(-)